MSFASQAAALFTPGGRFVEETPRGAVEYRVDTPRRLGTVVLPTGHVVACEPPSEMRPFAVTVPPGAYTFQAIDLIITMCDGEVTYPEVAALQLVIRDGSPVRWEPALVTGQTLPDQYGEGDAPYGHMVDGGLTTLADVTAMQAVLAWDHERWYAEVSRPDMPDSREVVVDEVSGANMIIANTGGDGVFATLVGYLADGMVASFATIITTPPQGSRQVDN